MSGTLPSEPDEALTVLAGEYVLGMLPRDEAARVEAEADGDPLLAGAIADWERRLAPLLLSVAAVAPPTVLWPRIAATAFGRAEDRRSGGGTAGDRPRSLLRSLPVWRGVAAAGLLAAAVSGIALLARPPAPVPVAVLAPLGAARPAFVLEAARDGGLTVVPIHPAAVPAGRDLELWSLAEGAKLPHPLGVLPVGGMLRLAADRLPAGPSQILVSLEPTGGSPTGLPTGPVLYGAAIGRPE